MPWRQHIETAVWIAVLGGVLWFTVERLNLSKNAIAKLEADGYRNVRLIGHDCRVAKAVDADGEEVTAFACLTK